MTAVIPRSGPVRLETARLVLRELEVEDAAATNLWESDPQVVRYQSVDVQSPEESRAYIEEVRREMAEEPRRLWDLGVERRTDGELVGRVGLRIARPAHREAEIWFVLRRDVWGQGHGTEAVSALLDHAFGVLALHRVFGDCDPRNAASAGLMEKLGMRREAHLRENWWLKGEWCDSLIYAILDHEWSARARAR